MESLLDASRLLRKMTSSGFWGLWCSRAIPLLVGEFPLMVLMVLTLGAMELYEWVLIVLMTEAVAREERERRM
jgi:hypothetical protein